MVRAIIFDCFGVLVTDALAAISAEASAKNPAVGRQIHDLIQAVNHGMVDHSVYRQSITDLLGISAEEYKRRIADGEVKNQALMNHIRELRSTYKIGMLSNISSTERLLARFTAEELDTHFDVVVASGDIGYAKPEAQAYEVTADQLGVRLNECIFVDDREGYCQGARGVGMQAIAYTDYAQFRTELDELLANT